MRYKSGRFSNLVSRKIFTSVLADFEKYLTSNGATSFLDWICPKYTKSYKKVRRLRGHDKVQKCYCFYLFRPKGLTACLLRLIKNTYLY